jgi:glycosyltransferase involved in cell wall biosynthesis
MKTALVYDRVNKWGGAERVLLALHEIFPEALLYTSVYDEKAAPWAKVFPEIKTSFLQKFPFAKSNHEFLGTLMPIVFESFDFSKFDLVISVTSEAAKGIITKPGTVHICYMLTPTRYLWSQYEGYFKNPIFKSISKPFVNYLRGWDKIAASRPDKIVAISQEVKDRIEKYYGRKSNVIFPPVDLLTQKNSIDINSHKKHYLLVSRLDYGYKKVDLAVKAFNNLGYPLIIVGTGREKKKLENMAKNNIKFVGKVSEKELVGYYQNAKALIMPQEEDFGIVSVEAQSFGVPVIAYKKGGVLDTVIPGKTGYFFDKQTVESLENVIRNFDNSNGSTIKSSDCVENAKRFSKEEFKRELLDAVKNVRMK